MKYVLRIHARPSLELPVDRLNRNLVATLRELDPPWRFTGEYSDPFFEKDDFTAQINLGSGLGKELTGFANYRMRSGLRDDSNCDDFIDIEFRPTTVNMDYVASVVFPRLVTAFHGYLGYVGDEEFNYIDFDRSRNFNRRFNVLRFYAMNYFDRELCKAAFGEDPSALLKRLTEYVAEASLLLGGLLVIGAIEALTVREAESLNAKLMAAVRETNH